ncbi:sigma-70 family RNA polymerase sigma factor [Galbibacter sp. BG1]
MTKINTLKLFEQYHTTNNSSKKDKLKEQIINNHIPFVKYIANEWNRIEHKKDLIQVGIIGLMKAFEGFDYTKNYSFTTYSKAFIWGEMNKYVKNQSSTIHIPLYKYYNKNDDEEYPYQNVTFNHHISSSLYEDANYIYDEKEEMEIQHKQVNQYLTILDKNPKHKFVVINYLGLNCKQKSMQEIGKELNVTRNRIHQIYNEAINIIKENVIKQK